MRQRVLIALIAVLVLACAALAYRVVDQAVTATYQSESLRQQEETQRLLAQIAVDLQRECRQPDLAQWFKDHYSKQHIVKEEDGALFIDGVGLRFEAGKLREIVFMR